MKTRSLDLLSYELRRRQSGALPRKCTSLRPIHTLSNYDDKDNNNDDDDDGGGGGAPGGWEGEMTMMMVMMRTKTW